MALSNAFQVSLRAARRTLRAALLLDPQEQRPETSDGSESRVAVAAARLRLKPARQLVNRGEPVAGLVLYRDASRLVLPTVLAVSERERVPIPPNIERHAALLSSTDSHPLDRLEPTEALREAEELDQVVESALELLDRPTEAQRRVQRGIRLSILGVVVLSSVIGGVAWFRRLPNLALRKQVAASSAAFGTDPQKVNDGVRYGPLGFHTNGPGSEWWSVDLGRVYRLDRVAAYGRADCCFDQSIPLALELSLDGKHYKQVASRAEIFTQTAPWVISGLDREARFVRLRTLRATYLVLAEVEVYGHPGASRSKGEKRRHGG